MRIAGGWVGGWQPTLMLALGKGLSFEAFRLKSHPLPILALPLPELHNNSSIGLLGYWGYPLWYWVYAGQHRATGSQDLSLGLQWKIAFTKR